MTDLPRRGFLSGLFGGLVGAGVLVKAATVEEVHAFARPLAPDQPLVLGAPAVPLPGQHLYNAQGEFVAVITSFRLPLGELTAHLVGALKWLPDEQRFLINGRRSDEGRG